MSAGTLTSLLKRSGIVRTDMDCHACREKGQSDKFVAELNHDLNGNHKIECPRCAHIHYRVIKDGIVSEERYNSGYPTHEVKNRNVWKSETVPIVTSTAAAFMRDRWLRTGMD